MSEVSAPRKLTPTFLLSVPKKTQGNEQDSHTKNSIVMHWTHYQRVERLALASLCVEEVRIPFGVLYDAPKTSLTLW